VQRFIQLEQRALSSAIKPPGGVSMSVNQGD